MTRSATTVRVFLGSPEGLGKLRKAFERVLVEFNQDEGYFRGVRFEAYGYEDVPRGLGRPQAKINPGIEESDFAVFVFFDRWGNSATADPLGRVATKEEFDLATECAADLSKPLRDVLVLFKNIPPARLAAASQDPQLPAFRLRSPARRARASPLWSYWVTFLSGLQVPFRTSNAASSSSRDR